MTDLLNRWHESPTEVPPPLPSQDVDPAALLPTLPALPVCLPESRALDTARRRLRWGLLGYALAMTLIGVRLVDLMVLRTTADGDELTAVSASAVPPPAARADIFDRNGVLLATSLPTASLYADPTQITDKGAAAQAIAAVLPGEDEIGLLEKLSGPGHFIWLRRNLTPAEHQAVFSLGLPGLYFQREDRRFYPQGHLFASLVGLTGIDGNGMVGIEAAQDRRLRQGGSPLILSIDSRIQLMVREELLTAIADFNAIGGAGLVMDVRNGEILSLVSLPDYEPGEMAQLIEAQTAEAKATGRPGPCMNKITLCTYELGSVFKLMTVAMALDSGRVKLTDHFDAIHPLYVGRRAITDFKGQHRMLSVPEVIQYSSNLGAARIAKLMGIQAQRDFLKKLGQLDRPKLEVQEIGWPLWPKTWREANLLTIAFGHGISVTPIQAARAIAAIANGGQMVQPTLLRRDPALPVETVQIIKPETSDTMRRLMRLVVTGGSATKAEVPGYFLGGKTGTAEKAIPGKGYSDKARLSTFMGVFPMHDPKYLVMLMVDEPKPNAKSYGYATAGWVAAPATKRLVERMAPMLGIAPLAADDPAVLKALAVPGVRHASR